jgi:hypothetical protein
MAADRYAQSIVPMIEALLAEGVSRVQIAKRFRADGVLMPRGGTGWTPTAVRRVIERR